MGISRLCTKRGESAFSMYFIAESHAYQLPFPAMYVHVIQSKHYVVHTYTHACTHGCVCVFAYGDVGTAGHVEMLFSYRLT